MNEIKSLTLDYSTWKCGEKGPYELGKGQTVLLNSEGFMCCLGQWSLQCGAVKEEILDIAEPHEVKTLIPFMTGEEVDFEEELEDGTVAVCKSRVDKKFVGEAMNINDNSGTTPEEKIALLTELLKKEGVELVIINKPENPLPIF